MLRHLNFFESYGSNYEGSCTPVVGVPGVEDIAADETLSIAWLSSMDRRADNNKTVTRGTIVAFDPANPLDTASWKDRTNGAPEVFEPLGLDLYEDESARRLFVVNKAGKNILIYNIGPNGELALADMLSDRRLSNPNSIVAVGPRSFYVTNSTRTSGRGLLYQLGFVFGQASGSVLHYDGNSWSNAAEDLKLANGIEVSVDGTTLYVAETADKALTMFDRDPATGIILRAGKLKLDAFPDNLNRLADGSLLIGAIPKPLAFSSHAGNQNKSAPSQIMKVSFSGNGNDAPHVLYQDDGNQLSGATSAIRLGSNLLIGAYAENKFLLCE